MIAKMRNIGEACTAANRFLVAESVADEFAEKLAAKLGAMKVGRGTEEDVKVGPLIDDDQRGEGRRAGGRCARQGRQAVLGGTGATARATSTSRRCSPACRDDARLLREEIFGPVAPSIASTTRRRRSRRPTTPSTASSPTSSRRDIKRAFRVVRGPRDRHGRPQPGHRLQPRRAVRRRQGVRLRPRGRPARASTSTSRSSTWRWRCDRSRGPCASARRLVRGGGGGRAAGARRDGARHRRRRRSAVGAHGAAQGARRPRRRASSPTTRAARAASWPRTRAGARFHWHAAQRQVRLEGPVERLADVESDAYFAARRSAAACSAWASRAGQRHPRRADLDAACAAASDVRYPGERSRARRTGAATGFVRTRSSSGRAAQPAARPHPARPHG